MEAIPPADLVMSTIKIKFKNEIGVDDGGLSNEWLTLL